MGIYLLLQPATIVYNLGGRRDVRQITMFSDWWAKRPDDGTLEICVLQDDEDPQRLGCTEWQTVSNFVFEGGNQNTCGVDGCSPCSYQPGDGSESAGGVSHLPVSFSPALMDVYKIRVTFNSLVDDGNEDVIFKELVVTDTLRYDCQAISCKGCAPFDPTCNPELVDVEAAECLQPEVIISRTASGDPIGCIGATVDGLHEAYCIVDDEDLPATVVYDLGRPETLEQIVLLSDWWAKRPDGGQLEVCDTDHWIGGDEECEATPLEQCLAECDEDGKGLYEDPLEVPLLCVCTALPYARWCSQLT